MENNQNIKTIGRPKGIPLDKTKITTHIGRPKGSKTNMEKVTVKLGRPVKDPATVDVFAPDKRVLTRQTRIKKGEHMNKIIKYSIVMNDNIYYFSSIKQIACHLNCSCVKVMKLLDLYIKIADSVELNDKENKLFNQYSFINEFKKVPIDKNKKIIGILMAKLPDKDNLNLIIECPKAC